MACIAASASVTAVLVLTGVANLSTVFSSLAIACSLFVTDDAASASSLPATSAHAVKRRCYSVQ